jgi:hypothetical protein
MTDDLTKMMKYFNQLYFMKKTFDKKADECQEKMNKLKPVIESVMIDNELQKISFSNGITSSLESLTWAKVHDKRKAVRLLKKEGLKHLVLGERVSYQGLSAHIRELERNKEPLPESWKDVIEANPVSKIVPRKL